MLHTSKQVAESFIKWVNLARQGKVKTSGPCLICGSETTNERTGRHGGTVWVCLYDTGEGLACYEVWRNREDRARLPSHHEFVRKCGSHESIDASDYHFLEVPWRDAHDEYSDYQTYIQSREWNIKAWRAKSLARWRCQQCGRAGDFSSLDAHHKHYRTLFKERRQDIGVLCRNCHKREHGRA